MSAIHILKTLPQYWDAIERGEKTFDVRRDDRGFQKGDVVVLRRLSEVHRGYDSPPGGGFGTRDLSYRIGWILTGGQFGIEPGYVVLSLHPLDPTQAGGRR